MNKQEALEALKENSWEFETNYFKYELVIDLKDAQEIISQIDTETGEILDGGRLSRNELDTLRGAGNEKRYTQKMKVWALFSVDLQQYYQPDNNLETLFLNKPSLDQLSKVIYGRPLAELSNDDCILGIVNLYKGKEVIVSGTEYRIEEVEVQE